MNIDFGKAYLDAIETRVFDEAVKMSSEGIPIAGVYCAFTPKELIAAAGAIPVALCSGTREQIPSAELHLPANLCPLVKSSYGNALSDTCPYFHMTDFLIADATCDGKKKMFELLADLRPLTLLNLPQTYGTDAALENWYRELLRLRGILERLTGKTVTDDGLREQIRLFNRFRDAVCRVYEMNRGEIPAFSGYELTSVTSSGGFECNLPERILEMEKAMEAARRRMEEPEYRKAMTAKPRILMTGCPTTNKKVLHLIEETGGAVVAMETCGGLKTAGAKIEETGDPLRAIADRYIATPCSCMTPNTKRIELIEHLAETFKADGVLELTWVGCHTYNIESCLIEKAVTGRMGIPYLHVETDYSEHDTGQLTTRIEAFLEIISDDEC